jgi:flagellar biosynthetic protein FlhB
VARGADEVAARLRAEASEAGVPIITDPPLARSVYGTCVVGDLVPFELYEAVAKLLAEVYRIRPVSHRTG